MRDEAAFLKALRASPRDRLARLAFADWLDERGDQRAAWVRDPDVFKWMGPKAESPIPALMAALGKVANARWGQVCQALIRIGAPAVPALLDALPHANDRQRVRTAIVLHSMGAGAAGALPDLLRAAAGPDPRMRLAGVEGLASASHVSPQAAARLLELALDADREVHSRAVAKLATDGVKIGPEALPTLLTALRRNDDDSRGSAAAAIGRLGPAAAP